ncbi:hypothetical protein [Streptomyces sp. NPDC060010]
MTSQLAVPGESGLVAVMSVISEDTADGARLVQWTDKDKPNQHFRLA